MQLHHHYGCAQVFDTTNVSVRLSAPAARVTACGSLTDAGTRQPVPRKSISAEKGVYPLTLDPRHRQMELEFDGATTEENRFSSRSKGCI